MTRGKGEGSVYKRADGLWCTSIELPPGPDNKRRRKVVCRKDKAAVVKVMQDNKKQLAIHGDITTNSVTVEKWVKHWIEDIAPLKIRPKTLSGYQSIVDRFIIPILGKKRLDKLSAHDIRALHQTIQSTPKDQTLRGTTDLPPGTEMLSGTYALAVHNVLSAALKVALRDGKIPVNPCDLVDRPSRNVSDQKALDVPQAIQLLQYVATRPDGALWATYILTGARRGEVLGLEADRVGDHLDLSWQLQSLSDISKAPNNWEYRPLGGKLYLTRPKSKAGWRVIPLVEPLRSILKLHMGTQTEGLVFNRAGKPVDPYWVTKEWKRVLAAADLPTDVVLHGARHTTVDLLYEAGVPEAVISEIVGHSSRAVTRGYKSRGNSKQLADAMGKMSELLGVTQ